MLFTKVLNVNFVRIQVANIRMNNTINRDESGQNKVLRQSKRSYSLNHLQTCTESIIRWNLSNKFQFYQLNLMSKSLSQQTPIFLCIFAWVCYSRNASMIKGLPKKWWYCSWCLGLKNKLSTFIENSHFDNLNLTLLAKSYDNCQLNLELTVEAPSPRRWFGKNSVQYFSSHQHCI